MVSVATVLTVYGIETHDTYCTTNIVVSKVATVLTVYGIETLNERHYVREPFIRCNSTYRLRY